MSDDKKRNNALNAILYLAIWVSGFAVLGLCELVGVGYDGIGVFYLLLFGYVCWFIGYTIANWEGEQPQVTTVLTVILLIFYLLVAFWVVIGAFNDPR